MSLRADSYESSLTLDTKHAKGIYYTPNEIVDELFATIEARRDAIVCDPCCGCGNIVVGALKAGFRAENIYGFDIDPEAVKIAQERIFAECGFDATQNIRVGDFFEVSHEVAQNYDVVVSNPPWGAEIERKQRTQLAARFGVANSCDSSALMLLATLESVREGGELAFLLPDAFFNIGGFEGVRRKILELEISHLIDFGTPFKGVMSRAQSVTLVKRKRGDGAEAECRFEGATHHREIESFARNPKAIINMWATPDEAKAIEQIFAKPHATLTNRATWGMGIVTGNNSKYCSQSPAQGMVGVVRGYNLTAEGITAPDTFIDADLTLYQQVAPESFYRAGEKIIYKFISSKLLFCVDREGRYILNSANGLIPDKELGMSCVEVAQRLNSQVVGWLFRALFRTHKILRRDIEELPLHLEFESERYEDYLGVEPTPDGSYRVKN